MAGTVLALSAFVGSPALAAESRGTLPEGCVLAFFLSREYTMHEYIFKIGS